MNDFLKFKQELKHANPYRDAEGQFATKDNYTQVVGDLPNPEAKPEGKPKKSASALKTIGKGAAIGVLSVAGATALTAAAVVAAKITVEKMVFNGLVGITKFMVELRE